MEPIASTLPGQTEMNVLQPISVQNGRIILIDQRHLPEKLEYFDATELAQMVFAIKEMVVRGAPAIGVAAAIGLAAQAVRIASACADTQEFIAQLKIAKNILQDSRPTAVNLRWATEQVFALAESQPGASPSIIARGMMNFAQNLIDDDIRINRSIGDNGASLLNECRSVLTHCNAGALATCGWGTALGVIRSAVANGIQLTVYVDETRPRQQGARLTVWELQRDGIIPTLITDNMAGYMMAQGKVDAVIVGADRIANNGDAANKIGTYSLAVLARAHEIPFYVAAPISTIDPLISTGAEIPIEERDPEEVLVISGQRIAAEGTKVENPAFDVTPARLITAIITEKGVLRASYVKSIAEALES